MLQLCDLVFICLEASHLSRHITTLLVKLIEVCNLIQEDGVLGDRNVDIDFFDVDVPDFVFVLLKLGQVLTLEGLDLGVDKSHNFVELQNLLLWFLDHGLFSP